jgi:hypothetical protein
MLTNSHCKVFLLLGTRIMPYEGLKAWSPAPIVKSTKIPLVNFGDAMFGDKKNGMQIKGKQHGIVT